MRTQTERDAAIYAPSANAFYDNARVTPDKGGGGAEFQTTQLAAGLAGRGLSVAHISYPVSDPVETFDGLDIVQRGAYAGHGGSLSKLREGREIWRAMAEADADVYILRGYGLQLIVGAIFARLRKRAVLMSGSNDIDFMPARRNASRLGALAYGRAIGSANLIVTQTDQQRRVALANFPGRDVSVIRSFAEPAEVSERDGEAFLWVGRLVDYKRPLKFLELARQMPEAKFWMIGVETSETPPALSAAVDTEAGELENVELLQPRPRGELMDLIDRSAAVVLTSEFEGMPNVFLEAWMRGRPVVTFGFDPDGVVGARRCGVAANGDFDDFVRGARQIWGDPSARRQMGHNGRRYVLEEHGPDAVGDHWADAVRALENRS